MGDHDVRQVRRLVSEIAAALERDDDEATEALSAQLEQLTQTLSDADKAEVHDLKDFFSRLCLAMAARRDEVGRRLAGLRRGRKVFAAYRTCGAAPDRSALLDDQA